MRCDCNDCTYYRANYSPSEPPVTSEQRAAFVSTVTTFGLVGAIRVLSDFDVPDAKIERYTRDYLANNPTN